MGHSIRLPWRFYRDHEERALPSGVVVKQSAAHVLVACTDDELAEIESDARFYADEHGPDGEGLSGIKSSARATIRAIEAYRQERGE
jgi:hypothetical protein